MHGERGYANPVDVGEGHHVQPEFRGSHASILKVHVHVDSAIGPRKGDDLLPPRIDFPSGLHRDDGLGHPGPSRARLLHRAPQSVLASLSDQVGRTGRQNGGPQDSRPHVVTAVRKQRSSRGHGGRSRELGISR